MNTPATTPNTRLERELAREREERHKNDEARAGILGGDDLRTKDARESNHSFGQMHRKRER